MIITSKDNQLIKLYQKLMTSKKYRNEENMFVLEGARIIDDAVKENLDFHCVLITEKAVDRYSEIYNNIKNNINEDKIFIISDVLSEKLSDTKTPQGIFAVVKKLDKVLTADKIINNGHYIILCNLQDPGNIGTIIRTADAVGIDGIFLTDDCCEIYNPKLMRSTMGSLFRMNFWDGCNIISLIEMLDSKGIPTFASVIDTDATSLIECNFSNGAAVLIGNEGNGLPYEVSQMCTNRLTIKMQGNINSLNAAMATGIIMWEMLK